METIVTNYSAQHHRLMGNRFLLFASWLLNIGASLSHIPMWIQAILWTITVFTTIMAFFNTLKTFRKNFRTTWIVVTVNHIFTFMVPKKKNRHRGIAITKNKTETK